MNSPLNLDARSILFEVTLYLSSSFTNFILKIWRSINFITCLCSPAPAIDICCWGLLYWPLSSNFNVLSSDLETRGVRWWCFTESPVSYDGHRGRCLRAGGAHCGDQAQGANTRWWRIQGAHLHLTGLSSHLILPARVIIALGKFDIKPMSFDFCRKQWGILQ